MITNFSVRRPPEPVLEIAFRRDWRYIALALFDPDRCPPILGERPYASLARARLRKVWS
jgi:hypothetical protein